MSHSGHSAQLNPFKKTGSSNAQPKAQGNNTSSGALFDNKLLWK